MKIVEYNDSFYDDVCRILKDCFGVIKSNTSDDRAYEFVALEGDKVVGYYVLNEVVDIVKDFKMFYINYVCVDVNFQGRGIGKSMINNALSFARDSGCKRVELTSHNSREIAQKLYLDMGFEKRDSSIFRKELL